MDCFDTHYYQFNRKLLQFVGQWPYQDFGDRLKRWILYLCIIISAMVTQVAKLLMTELDFDLCIEILSDQLAVLLSCVRYFTYTVNKEKVKSLVDNMRTNWQSLNNNEENEIFGETAEEGRLYTLYYMMIVSVTVLTMFLLTIARSVLNNANVINVSQPHFVFYPAEYFVDLEKYYYIIMLHMDLTVLTILIPPLATDFFFMVFMYHIVGMFKITGYRLERAFDNCDIKSTDLSGRTIACERIAIAVEYHRRAIRFCDRLVAAYNWPTFVALLLIVVNITASLYSGVTSKGEICKMMFGLLFGIGQMIHMLALDIPAQLVTDHSQEVINKAYNSFWYNADVKDQSLLLLTMQRSLRPTYVTLGKIHPMSLENYATEVKAAFSYFTMLMSLK